jgi:hypothetical protein
MLQSARHSGAERSEEPGIHNHNRTFVARTEPNLRVVAMDSGLAGFARAPE